MEGRAGQFLHAALLVAPLHLSPHMASLALLSLPAQETSPHPLLAAPALPSPICTLHSAFLRSGLTSPLPCLQTESTLRGVWPRWAGPCCLCSTPLAALLLCRTALGWSWKHRALGFAVLVRVLREERELGSAGKAGPLRAGRSRPAASLLQDLTLLPPQASAESLHQPLCDVLAQPGLHGVTLAWLPWTLLHEARACPPLPNRPGHGHLKGQRMDGEAGQELVTERWELRVRGRLECWEPGAEALGVRGSTESGSQGSGLCPAQTLQ